MDVGSLLSVTETAELLGVDRTRVQALIVARRLPAIRVGRDWRISVSDATRLQHATRRPGRPLAPARAWTVLANAERSGIIDLPRSSATRDPFWFVNLTRRRATVRRIHVLDSLISHVADELIAGGESAGRHHAFAPHDGRPVCDGYIVQSKSEDLVEQFAMVDAAGTDVNAVLRIVADDVWPFRTEDKTVGPLVAALDMLSDPIDDRSVESALPIVERYL